MKRLLSALYLLAMVCMGIATFVEKSRGTEYVATHIYGAWWFSAIWALLVAVGAWWIFHQRMKRKSLWMLHGSFAVILLGALVTHTTRWQGYITVRQGSTVGEVVVVQGRGEGNTLTLPFTLRLDSFQVVNHEGTDAAFDYVSKLTVSASGKSQTVSIAMNKTATIDGITILQSGYDKDKLGSTLMFTYDPWGTGITYAGYLLLLISLLWTLFEPQSTFRRLLNHPLLREATIALALLLALPTMARAADAKHSTLPREQAHDFGQLLMLYKGRICPVQTFALDFTRKVYGSSSYKGLSAEQVLAGWLLWSDEWSNEPFIKVGGELRSTLQIDKHVSLNFFFNQEMGGYILGPYVQEYYAGQADKFHRDVAAVDERLQIVMDLRRGASLKVFPVKQGHTVTWLSAIDSWPSEAPQGYHLFAQNMATLLSFNAQSGDYATLDELVGKLSKLQQRDGGKSLPSPTQVKAERLYNSVPFNTLLFIVNLTVGLASFLLRLRSISKRKVSLNPSCGGKPRRNSKPTEEVDGNNTPTKSLPHRWSRRVLLSPTGGVGGGFGVAVMALSFLTLTLFVALRWIVSGSVPMANGFETMLFLAWIVMLVSLVCVRRMPIVLTFGFIMSGFFLLVSHISQMDPQISTLMPVLNSPWLTFHVSIIMFAFALLSITFICSLTALIITKAPHHLPPVGGESSSTMLPPTGEIEGGFAILSRLFLYPAVATLAIGIFIGAVWAAQSWGTYWSWDPKETWALITMMVYAIPLHSRTVASLNRPMAYHVFMVVAFLTILMTYFGVNFFLGGMHSYA